MSHATAAPAAARQLESAQWRQLLWITFGAIAVYFTLRLLPTGTNLSHMDFRVDPRGGAAIEFCDPSNPQFIPVVAMRSPVVMTLATPPARPGVESRVVVTLKTSGGKPIAPEDLLPTHTRPLHVLIVDPTLTDYQHEHPQPGKTRGEWTFAFTPQRGGTYRIFADFTPGATGRGLYASADLVVADGETARAASQGEVVGSALPAGRVAPAELQNYRFALATAQQPVRAGQAIDLQFTARRHDGGAVPLQAVMDAVAHLVAFDRERSGFAHLHPVESEKPLDPKAPVLNFKLTIPRAGDYVVWAQLNLEGREAFVPFPLEVVSGPGGD
jgi:hypothetical protein